MKIIDYHIALEIVSNVYLNQKQYGIFVVKIILFSNQGQSLVLNFVWIIFQIWILGVYQKCSFDSVFLLRNIWMLYNFGVLRQILSLYSLCHTSETSPWAAGFNYLSFHVVHTRMRVASRNLLVYLPTGPINSLLNKWNKMKLELILFYPENAKWYWKFTIDPIPGKGLCNWYLSWFMMFSKCWYHE